MWKFDVNDLTQNNNYVQWLATLCVLQPLSRDLRQTSTERFVKTADAGGVCGAKISLPLALQVPRLDWVVQGVTISCLFSRTIGTGNWASQHNKVVCDSVCLYVCLSFSYLRISVSLACMRLIFCWRARGLAMFCTLTHIKNCFTVCEYHVQIVTATGRFASTKALVYIKLYGSEGSCPWKPLNPPGGFLSGT